jgi:fumarate reductase flavoprotein subunit
MARAVADMSTLHAPDDVAIATAQRAALAPFDRAPTDLESIRERLHQLMWDEVGIVRDGEKLVHALDALRGLDSELDTAGVTGGREFNLTWHDWLNLKNLVLVSRAIAASAMARDDSRGAHFRSDHPASSDLASSRYVVVRYRDGALQTGTEPVDFTRVKPGESLLDAESRKSA